MPDDPTPGKTYLIASKATGRQLDWPGPDDSAGPFQLVPHDIGFAWLVESADVGLRFVVRPESATSVGGTSVEWHKYRLDSNFERQVYIEPANDGAYQKWRKFSDGEGYWQLINVATGYALDGTDSDIYTHEPNDGAFQRWAFHLAGPGDGQWLEEFPGW